jgi:hypothetical protein
MKKTRLVFYLLAVAIIILTVAFSFSTPTVAQTPLQYEPKPMNGASPDQISNATNLYLRSWGAVSGPNQPKLIRTVSADELEKRLDLQLPSLDPKQTYVLVILNGQFKMTGFPGNSDSPHPTTDYIAVGFEESTGKAVIMMSLDGERLLRTALGDSY